MAAATELLNQGGAAGLSMRSLASTLGVSPNALYNHVQSKNELIEALLDDALGAIDPALQTGPRAAIEAIMTATYDVLTSHRDLVPLYLAHHGARGANAIALGDRLLDALRSLGIDEEPGRQAMYVLIVQTIGFSAYASGIADPDANRTAFLDSLQWTLNGVLTPPYR